MGGRIGSSNSGEAAERPVTRFVPRLAAARSFSERRSPGVERDGQTISSAWLKCAPSTIDSPSRKPNSRKAMGVASAP
jgi:hypothetical protein